MQQTGHNETKRIIEEVTIGMYMSCSTIFWPFSISSQFIQAWIDSAPRSQLVMHQYE